MCKVRNWLFACAAFGAPFAGAAAEPVAEAAAASSWPLQTNAEKKNVKRGRKSKRSVCCFIVCLVGIGNSHILGKKVIKTSFF